MESAGRATFSRSRRSLISARDTCFSSTVGLPPSRPPQVLGLHDRFLDLSAEPDVDDVGASLLPDDRARLAMEPIVGPSLLEGGIDSDHGLISDLEPLE